MLNDGICFYENKLNNYMYLANIDYISVKFTITISSSLITSKIINCVTYISCMCYVAFQTMLQFPQQLE